MNTSSITTSFYSTNEEVRRIVENSDNKLILGQSSTIWTPTGQYSRLANLGGPGPSRQVHVRHITDFRNQDPNRTTAFRATGKAIRRMTVNAGDHGDVGVVVVDERHHQEHQIPHGKS